MLNLSFNLRIVDYNLPAIILELYIQSDCAQYPTLGKPFGNPAPILHVVDTTYKWTRLYTRYKEALE